MSRPALLAVRAAILAGHLEPVDPSTRSASAFDLCDDSCDDTHAIHIAFFERW
jgi:hypothetical protein